MSVEENKALIRRYFEFGNARNVEAGKDCYSPVATLIYNTPPGEMSCRERFKLFAMQMSQVFPDYRYHIEDIFGEGDRVAVRYTFTGTHRGELRGFAPTGQVVTSEGIAIYRIVDGKILESRRQSNTNDVLLQLRALSAKGQSPG